MLSAVLSTSFDCSKILCPRFWCRRSKRCADVAAKEMSLHQTSCHHRGIHCVRAPESASLLLSRSQYSSSFALAIRCYSGFTISGRRKREMSSLIRRLHDECIHPGFCEYSAGDSLSGKKARLINRGNFPHHSNSCSR